MKILIIEDEEVLGEVLKEKFDEEKFTCTWKADGESGLKEVEKMMPDMVLLDLILPKMDGFDVLREIKDNPKTKNIPVVVLSNLGEDEEIKKALSLGALDYMVKAQHPMNEVVAKVKQILLKGK